MKSIIVFSMLFSLVYINGCNDKRKTDTTKDEKKTNIKTEQKEVVKETPKATDLVSRVANDACDCLKPLQVLQAEYKNGKIGVAEYSEGMRSITADLGNCVSGMQESLADEGDKMTAQKEVLRRMGELCPDVSGVMFQGN